jgi:hypothetical protein
MPIKFPSPRRPFLIRAFSALLPLLSVCSVSAQLVIEPGTTFTLAGNVQLTLQNTDLVNNGSFTAGTGQTTFTGNAVSAISGSQPIQFFGLEIGKTGASSVLLQRPIGVSQRVLFTTGFLDLNSFDADLGATGSLAGEQENSRITGANGGQVISSVLLDAPAGANPGNLGAILTSSKNLGAVTIKRGHQPQNGTGMANSITRFYDITPVNNTGLNATLRLTYFDGELNGFAENALSLFRTDDGVNWSNIGFSTRDTTANFVEVAGLASFSRWTLSTDGVNLPVRFLSFDATCETNAVRLDWVTAQEQNSGHFNIERSDDGIQWTVIGVVTAAGNSTVPEKYSYSDGNGVLTAYYRIAEVDLDGSARYTGVLRSSCAFADMFSVWPNPVHDLVFIKIVTAVSSKVTIRLIDSKGGLVRDQEAFVSPGSNQFNIDIRSLSAGMYVVSVFWDNGQSVRTAQVLKQ